MTIKEETLFTNEETANSKQLAILKKHFPQCFDKQGKFIQEKMLEVVQASDTELSQESYGLNWLGKSYAQLLTNLPPETLISADTDHNQKEQNKNSNNLLIKGDNLEVLKHMVNAYSEKIKMIYIDPPYNTGSDGFVYNDNRKFTKQQLSELASIEEDEAERILNFTDKGSNSHSAWLTFIYPRLYIARELLREDGVIFISIDDNEVSQLKILCDEVFGEGNFVSNICIKMSHLSGMKMSHKDKKIPKIKEFVLLYSKNKSNVSLNPVFTEGTWGNVLNRYDKYVEIIDNQDCTQWKIYNLKQYLKDKGLNDENSINNFKINNANKIFRTAINDSLKNESKDLFFKRIKTKTGIDKLIYKGEEVLFANKKIVEIDGKKAPAETIGDIWVDIGINNLHNEGGVAFENGKKPLKLVKRLLEIISKNNDIILDFFAGSGTTAHAVMQLNAEDGGNRQCISVQIGERTKESSEAFKAGYNTIFDITKARISKAGKKIKDDNREYKGDLGFKIYQTVEDFRDISDSKMVTDCSYDSNIDGMPKKNLILQLDDKKLTKSQYQSLLTTWCLYDGALLTTSIVDITLADYQAHLCDNRLYLLATGFSTEALKALLLKLDEDHSFALHKIIFYGNNFESATQRELNEAVTSYANKKSLAIELVVRY